MNELCVTEDKGGAKSSNGVNELRETEDMVEEAVKPDEATGARDTEEEEGWEEGGGNTSLLDEGRGWVEEGGKSIGGVEGGRMEGGESTGVPDARLMPGASIGTPREGPLDVAAWGSACGSQRKDIKQFHAHSHKGKRVTSWAGPGLCELSPK
jgi:hypothetical protein